MEFVVAGYGRFPFTVIALFIFISLSCAKQGFPPGGPEDKEPPKLIGSTPSQMMSNVSKHDPIKFEFSESMDESSVEDNVFVVPIPSSWPEFSWSDKSKVFIISFKEPLKDNTTYVISIGAKAQDLQRNKLDDTITLSFSTGDEIENGKITGRIIPYSFFGKEPENVSGIDVVAYRMEIPQSSPDPRNDVPNYFTQSGSDGSYEILGLSSALYRIFAIGDKDGDGFYTEGSDLIGIAPKDIHLAANDSVTAPMITISAKDTSSVQLRSVKVPDSRRVEIFFDKKIIGSTIDIAFDGLDIIGWFVDFENPKTISIATDPQEKGKRYVLKTYKVFDIDGNTVAPVPVIPEFVGTDTADTTALRIVDKGPDILLPGNEPVSLIFNRVLDFSDNTGAGLALADAGGEDLWITQSAPNILTINPEENWKEGYKYVVHFDVDILKSISGATLSDEGNELSFRVASSDTLGFLSGTIEDSTGTVDSVYHIYLKHLDTEKIIDITTIGSNNWSTEGVLPGSYMLYAFCDKDKDGIFSRGTLDPYSAAEHIVVFPDTVTVNSRWTKEDIRILFK
ncbi:MAG: Ig-like domain-containing protein [Candidatus Latescibacteria bacterium]|nr:Ig-like domain-containing protein [Candidatus Latescibacterota bacterium]